MITIPNYPIRRSSLVYITLASILISTTFFLSHPPLRAYLAPTYTLGAFASRDRSAWFEGAGHLRFDTEKGWGTIYETPADASTGGARDDEGVRYTCDGTASPATVCRSTIRLLRALVDNSEAQHRVLERKGAGGAREEDEADLRRTYAELESLRGKRLLYLGDSTDRSSIDEIARALPTGNWHMYEPVSGMEIPEFPASGSQHTTRFVSVRLADSAETSISSADFPFHLKSPIRADELRLDFLFTFGIFDFPAGDAQPVEFFDRLGLINPLLGRHARYDLVCINAGLWDLQKFGMEHPHLDPEAGLTADWVQRYINRFILVIKRIRIKYGSDIPIAIRLMHDIAPTSPTPKFTALRARQMREAQLEVVRRTGVRVLPFAELMRDQPFFYTPDGAHPNPAGNMLHSETMLRLLAET